MVDENLLLNPDQKAFEFSDLEYKRIKLIHPELIGYYKVFEDICDNKENISHCLNRLKSSMNLSIRSALMDDIKNYKHYSNTTIRSINIEDAPNEDYIFRIYINPENVYSYIKNFYERILSTDEVLNSEENTRDKINIELDLLLQSQYFNFNDKEKSLIYGYIISLIIEVIKDKHYFSELLSSSVKRMFLEIFEHSKDMETILDLFNNNLPKYFKIFTVMVNKYLTAFTNTLCYGKLFLIDQLCNKGGYIYYDTGHDEVGSYDFSKLITATKLYLNLKKDYKTDNSIIEKEYANFHEILEKLVEAIKNNDNIFLDRIKNTVISNMNPRNNIEMSYKSFLMSEEDNSRNTLISNNNKINKIVNESISTFFQMRLNGYSELELDEIELEMDNLEYVEDKAYLLGRLHKDINICDKFILYYKEQPDKKHLIKQLEAFKKKVYMLLEKLRKTKIKEKIYGVYRKIDMN